MAISVNTTAGTSVTVSVSGSTQASFSTESTSVSVTSPASSTISVLGKGAKGDKGDAGPTGQTGQNGEGVPTGGVQYQLLRKDTSDNYDTSWAFADRVTIEVRVDEAVSKGDPLYITGYNNGQNRITVAKADAADSSKMPSIGLAKDDYSQNDNGQATCIGSLEDVNTQVSPNDFQEGDVLYVKAGGGLTNVKPTGTNLIQNVGKVGRRQQNNGEIVVMAIGRSNDVPNIPDGQAWIGNSSGVATPTTLADVATSGAYSDITGTPSLAAVATSGSYNDLSNKPTIPTGDVVDDTTPELGGDLDVGDQSIVTTSGNKDITLTPNGTGKINLGTYPIRADDPAPDSGDNLKVLTYVHSDSEIRLVSNPQGTVTTTGTPGSTQIPFFSSSSVIRGSSNFKFSNNYFITPNVLVEQGTLSAPGAYGVGSRLTTTMFCDGNANKVAGDVYAMRSTDSVWTAKADADAVSTASGMLAVATGNSSGKGMLLSGIIRMDDNTNFVGASSGAILYLDTAEGHVTSSAPTGSGKVVRIVGYVVNPGTQAGNDGIIYFDPSKDWIELGS